MEEKDEALIRTLGLRLIAGQQKSGGWNYNCPMIAPHVEPHLLLALENTRPLNLDAHAGSFCTRRLR